MKWLRTEMHKEKGRFAPGEFYEVLIPVEIYWNPETQREEEAFSGEAMRKIEEAIEAVHPGWFHTCYTNPKQHCRACARVAVGTCTEFEYKDLTNKPSDSILTL